MLSVTSASVEDLMKADIWAYGLVVFNLTNPGLKHPFEVNMLTCIGTYTPLQCPEVSRDKACTRSSKCHFYQSTYIFSDCFRDQPRI